MLRLFFNTITLTLVLVVLICCSTLSEVSAHDDLAHTSASFKTTGSLRSLSQRQLVNSTDNANATTTTTNSSSLLERFDFYPHMDSDGNDIENIYSFSGIEYYAERCLSMPECRGFNSNGWLKHTIVDQDKWLHWTNDPTKGLYVKKTSTQAPTPVPTNSSSVDPRVRNTIAIVLAVFAIAAIINVVLFYNEGQETGDGPILTIDQIRERRRLKILSGIIHKKVLSKRKSEENEGDNENDENTEEEDIIVLPHEEELSRRSVVLLGTSQELLGTSQELLGTSQPLLSKDEAFEQTMEAHHASSIFPIAVPNDNDENEENEEEKMTNNDNILRKSNIYLASYRLSRMSLSERSSLYSPKSCPICLEEYKVGDEIAWSKNEECPHAFHLDCIMDWLMQHDECPLCRRDYINCEEDS